MDILFLHDHKTAFVPDACFWLIPPWPNLRFSLALTLYFEPFFVRKPPCKLNNYCVLTTTESRGVDLVSVKCIEELRWHRLLSILRRDSVGVVVVDYCSHCGVLCLFHVLLYIALYPF